MLQTISGPLVAGVISIALAAVLTYAVRAFAHRIGQVAKPKSDRWHKRPTAMLGGLGIFLATLIGYLIFVPKSPESLVIMGAATWLFIVGLIDDLYNVKPIRAPIKIDTSRSSASWPLAKRPNFCSYRSLSEL